MLEGYDSVTVRQAVELLQVFTGLETRNRYRILDPDGNEACFAYEESGFMARRLLGRHRPLSIHFIDGQGNHLLTARRKFFWFFSHLEMHSPDGGLVGRLQRRWKLIGRRFDLFDDTRHVGWIDGPLLRPHTFWLHHLGVESARITKRWSGLSREMFTAADTFHVEFTDTALSESMRWLVLGAALAIDQDFFEKRSRGTGFRLGALG